MVPIKINTNDVSAEFSLGQEQVNSMLSLSLKNVIGAFYENWMDETRVLGSSRQQYQRSILVVDEGPFRGSVILANALPNMIEKGISAFDMKDGFKLSSKVKYNADGKWYLTIPFRWSAPDSLGESEVFAGKLPLEVHAIVSKQEANIPIASGHRSVGISIEELPARFAQVNKRKEIFGNEGETRFKEYVHKSSIYEKIHKITDSKTGQNSYMSFRRVGENSDPMAFIHSGITARNLGEKALQETPIPQIIGASVDQYLEQIGKI